MCVVFPRLRTQRFVIRVLTRVWRALSPMVACCCTAGYVDGVLGAL